MKILVLALIILGFGFVFVALIATMIYDWKEGARQTYIRDDGTIHEWDRFGNQTLVRSNGKVETTRPEPDKGIGLLD